MILFQGVRVILGAIVVGTGGALLLTRFMNTFLFGVTEHDLVVFAGVPTVVTFASLGAVWLSARTIETSMWSARFDQSRRARVTTPEHVLCIAHGSGDCVGSD